MEKIKYEVITKDKGQFIVKGEFDNQKDAVNHANELQSKYPHLYFDYRIKKKN